MYLAYFSKIEFNYESKCLSCNFGGKDGYQLSRGSNHHILILYIKMSIVLTKG